MLKGVAWPVAFVVALVVVGRVARRAPRLLDGLKRLKHGDWEAEWHAPQPPSSGGRASGVEPRGDLEIARRGIYEESEGLFLVHQLRPSQEPGQLFDVGLFVVGHTDQTTGKRAPVGEIDRVEYRLGPRFGAEPIVVRDGRSGFRLNTSAYGPFACVARVHFKHPDKAPMLLKRYVDFENV